MQPFYKLSVLSSIFQFVMSSVVILRKQVLDMVMEWLHCDV